MSKKYYWTREEEVKLLDLWKKGITNLKVLAEQMNRPPEAVRQKLKRLAVVVKQQKIQRSTTTEVVPKDLLTHEQALKDLAGAVHDLKQRGLDKLELQRLRVLVDALQRYDSVLEKFEKWVEIEKQLLEMDKKIAEIKRIQDTAQ